MQARLAQRPAPLHPGAPAPRPLSAAGGPGGTPAGTSTVWGWNPAPGGRHLDRPPRPGVKSSPFQNRRAAEQRHPGLVKATWGHTLENHRSPGRLRFHCSDLWETCKTQAGGEGRGRAGRGPPEPGWPGRVPESCSEGLAEGHVRPGPLHAG